MSLIKQLVEEMEGLIQMKTMWIKSCDKQPDPTKMKIIHAWDKIYKKTQILTSKGLEYVDSEKNNYLINKEGAINGCFGPQNSPTGFSFEYFFLFWIENIDPENPPEEWTKN